MMIIHNLLLSPKLPSKMEDATHIGLLEQELIAASFQVHQQSKGQWKTYLTIFSHNLVKLLQWHDVSYMQMYALVQKNCEKA